MSVSFDRYGRTYPTRFTYADTSHVPYGEAYSIGSTYPSGTYGMPDSMDHSRISEAESSLENYGAPFESSLGFCAFLGQKLGEIWRSIQSCFSFRSAKNRNDAIESPLQMRIEKGAQIIDRHLSALRLEEVDVDRSAVVYVVKYNSEAVVHSRKLSIGESESTVAFARRHLSALLTSGAHANCQDGKLEIETLLFEKHRDNSFSYRHVESNIRFPNGNCLDLGNREAVNVGRGGIYDYLSRTIPDGHDRQMAFDLLINRL